MNVLSNISRSENDPKILRKGRSSLGADDRLAHFLGWFSIGLGLTELIAAPQLAKTFGMEGRETLIRSFGIREISAGVLTLSVDKQFGLWSRVAGDGIDIATLLAGFTDDNEQRDNVGLALIAVLGVTVLDLIAAQSTTSHHSRTRGKRRSYRDRSGFPQGASAARGAAKDFVMPSDMRAAPRAQPQRRAAAA
ncbi:MAG: hypothetical protein U1E46_08395 [Hyphomicrobiales bacterium]